MNHVVVFDVGGVLLDWNPRYLYRKLLPDEVAIDQFFDEVGFAAWNVQQDAGRLWGEAVADLTDRFPHRSTLIEAAHVRWHEMVPDAIHGTVSVLEALRAAEIPLYAVTNFSSEKWRETVGRFAFLNQFRDVVVSGDEKILKPQADIYQRLLERNGLQAQDCIFIDDSPANVAGAMAVGMTAIRFQSPKQLSEDLYRLGVLT